MEGRRDWRGGSAPKTDLVIKAEVDSPDALTRRSNSARNPSAGGRRWALPVCCRFPPAWSFSWFLVFVVRLDASSPFLPAPPGGSRGALKPARSMGVRRENRNLPSGRSRRRNAGRGPGRESPVAGCKGVRSSPCSMGPGRAEVSLRRDATATRLRSAGRGSMPVSASSVRLTNPLARTLKERVSLGIALGGARGMGNPPAR